MGACCSCLGREDFDYEEDRNGCCCRCCSQCCCGMYDALFHPLRDRDAGANVRSASPSQSAGLLGGISSGSSVSIMYNTPPDRRYLWPVDDASRPSFLQNKNSDALSRNNGGEGAVVMHNMKGADYAEGKTAGEDLNKFQESIKLGKVGSLNSLLDAEDICPTCLEGYDHENPKINTKCGHHFHLACILEWMERSNHCPVCDREMAFNESV